LRQEFFSIFLIAFGLGTGAFLQQSESERFQEPVAIHENQEVAAESTAVIDLNAGTRATTNINLRNSKAVRAIIAKPTGFKVAKVLRESKSAKRVIKVARKSPSVKVVGGRRLKVSRVEFTEDEMREYAERTNTPEKVRAAYARERDISSIDDQIVDSADLN
jgi:hypothetical protein